MLDYARGEYDGGCVHRDGEETTDANVGRFYFAPPESWSAARRERLAALDGPVADVGCGAGNDALWLQERRETVAAVDVSPNAVRAARERGVERALAMDMFDLGLRRNRFRSILLWGAQIGLAGSLAGAADLLCGLARIADGAGRLLLSQYDPDAGRIESLLGYRPDPRSGLARRTFRVEYERDGEREVGRTLRFLLFGPDRLREAAAGTPWRVASIDRSEPPASDYAAVLETG